jgi:maltose O-acetyltransferase
MKIIKHYTKKMLGILRGDLNIDKLKRRGLKVGVNFKAIGQNIIDPSHCWHIEIGDNVVLAPRVHILAHDSSTGLFNGYTKVANVTIGNNVFIGAGSIVLMGVTIGDNVIIGAGSIVAKDIPANSVAVGNPARVISSLENYLERELVYMNEENTFGEDFTLRNKKFNHYHVSQMIEACRKHKKAFVK